MINRLLDGIFHPMIYLGCGVEFNMPGVVAEGQSNTQAPQCRPIFDLPFRFISGLSQTAVHEASATPLIPLSLFETRRPGSVAPEPGLSALTILARIISDPELVVNEPSLIAASRGVIGQFGRKIKALVDEWDLTSTQKAVEELSWITTLLYGVAGRESDTKFTGDFFL